MRSLWLSFLKETAKEYSPQRTQRSQNKISTERYAPRVLFELYAFFVVKLAIDGGEKNLKPET
jgi:hypothetical protein